MQIVCGDCKVSNIEVDVPLDAKVPSFTCKDCAPKDVTNEGLTFQPHAGFEPSFRTPIKEMLRDSHNHLPEDGRGDKWRTAKTPQLDHLS